MSSLANNYFFGTKNNHDQQINHNSLICYATTVILYVIKITFF